MDYPDPKLAPSGVEWERFCRFLDLARNFTVAFLICPSVAHAEAARIACKAHLDREGLEMDSICPHSLLDLKTVGERLLQAEAKPDSVLWVALHPSSQEINDEISALESAIKHCFLGLNQTRNLLAKIQPRPVIFVGTATLAELAPNAAPDLWSIRSTVIRLTLPVSEEVKEMEIGSSRSHTENETNARVFKQAMRDADEARRIPGGEADLIRYLLAAARALNPVSDLHRLKVILDELVILSQARDLAMSSEERIAVLNELGDIYIELGGNSVLAETLFHRALEISEKSLGPMHHTTAASLLKVARLLTKGRHFNDAESRYRRALRIIEMLYGPEHQDVATSLNDLANLLAINQRLTEAESLYRRALTIREKRLGTNHPLVARSLNNLGILLKETRRLDEAEPLLRRALEIREQNMGPNHLVVASSLNSLGNLLMAAKRSEEAEPLYRRALEIEEKSLRVDHPLRVGTLNNLGNALCEMQRSAEAEPLYRRALAIQEKSIGTEDPLVAKSLNNLANLLQMNRHSNEAETLYRRALAIREKSFGPDHPEVATSLNNLGNLLVETGRPSEAESLYWRALAIREKYLPSEHPQIATTLINLAKLLIETGRNEEAQKLLQRASEIEKKNQHIPLSLTDKPLAAC